MKTRANPYSTELAYLADYLKRGFDPYDFSHQLERFYDEERDGRIPKWLDLDDPSDRLDQISKKDLADFKEWVLNQDLGADAPPYTAMEYVGIVNRETWLVHFSNDVPKIIREGMICGFAGGDYRYEGLHLTTWFKKKKCEPGWNFAFEADSRDAKNAAYAHGGGGKYGDDAVMFQSAGVEVMHYGDEERQIIFRGEQVKGFIPLMREGREFRVFTHDDHLIFSGDFRDAVDWVERNAKQYWKSIAYLAADAR